MKTAVLKIDRRRPESEKVRKAVEALAAGGVVALPTDTVYGLAVNAFHREAQHRIYRLKGRSFRKPLILMPPDIASLECLVEISRPARRLMEEFWPGPLTLILPTTTLGKMVTGGRQDVGVRIPDDAVVRAILAATGFPLATTSANPSAGASAVSGRDAKRYFDGMIEMILDGGASTIGRESTVVDVTHFHGVVVREGCLPSKKLLPFMV
jgi:L-threonylcarbamoyladenylate synthase